MCVYIVAVYSEDLAQDVTHEYALWAEYRVFEC